MSGNLVNPSRSRTAIGDHVVLAINPETVNGMQHWLTICNPVNEFLRGLSIGENDVGSLNILVIE